MCGRDWSSDVCSSDLVENFIHFHWDWSVKRSELWNTEHVEKLCHIASGSMVVSWSMYMAPPPVSGSLPLDVAPTRQWSRHRWLTRTGQRLHGARSSTATGPLPARRVSVWQPCPIVRQCRLYDSADCMTVLIVSLYSISISGSRSRQFSLIISEKVCTVISGLIMYAATHCQIFSLLCSTG